MSLIGMIDADRKGADNKYPNLAQMKLSAWHKSQGDSVEWAIPGKHYDKIYVSKVFSFTPDIDESIYSADEIVRGGSGYAIKLTDGREHYNKCNDSELPYEIEHIYPDYDLYGITDTAYGFMSRGCPRGCGFCHVKDKEGLRSHKVADLSEFWRGQKYIELMDPNSLACPQWEDILGQLVESKAYVNLNQGVDIRLMTEKKAQYFKDMKVKSIHFAYDRPEDQKMIEPKFRTFRDVTGWNRSKVVVFVLTNFNSTIEQDLRRIMFLRSLNFAPYVMRYDKEHIKRGAMINALARWTNFKPLWAKFPTFEDYIVNCNKGIKVEDIPENGRRGYKFDWDK